MRQRSGSNGLQDPDPIALTGAWQRPTIRMKPIWVVDDDQSIRFVLDKALTREQFAVRTFSSPREVLQALEDDVPQVLVSDCLLYTSRCV